jgi:hypothetical protein
MFGVRGTDWEVFSPTGEPLIPVRFPDRFRPWAYGGERVHEVITHGRGGQTERVYRVELP